MVKQNLHCHTTFDDGASTPEEMVCAAMEHGLSSLGISAHAPMDGEDWCTPKEKEAAFKAEMQRLKVKYAGRSHCTPVLNTTPRPRKISTATNISSARDMCSTASMLTPRASGQLRSSSTSAGPRRPLMCFLQTTHLWLRYPRLTSSATSTF